MNNAEILACCILVELFGLFIIHMTVKHDIRWDGGDKIIQDHMIIKGNAWPLLIVWPLIPIFLVFERIGKIAAKIPNPFDAIVQAVVRKR